LKKCSEIKKYKLVGDSVFLNDVLEQPGAPGLAPTGVPNNVIVAAASIHPTSRLFLKMFLMAMDGGYHQHLEYIQGLNIATSWDKEAVTNYSGWL
jgi:hypothetical protein